MTERAFTDDLVQYPNYEADGVSEFCRKCHPAARRMFTNLISARDGRERDLDAVQRWVLPLAAPDYDSNEHYPPLDEAVEQLCRELEQLRQLRERTELEAREKALGWARRQFTEAPITDAQAVGDAVLELANRYLTWLLQTPGGTR